MIRWFRRRRAFEAVRDLPHDDSARLMRTLAYNGVTDDPLVLILARRAAETAPQGDDEMSRSARAGLEKWVESLSKHRVKVGRYRVVVLEPVSDEMVEDVDSAFPEEQGETP